MIGQRAAVLFALMMWASVAKAGIQNFSTVDVLTSAPIDWQRLPSGEDIQRYYPPDALQKRLEGRATITCSVDLRGVLQDCRPVSETLQGAGFGDAAVRMARLCKLHVKFLDGVPIPPVAQVTFEVRFRPLPAPAQ